MSVPRFATIHQIAAVTGRHYITVYRNAARAGLLSDKPDGEKQHRIPLAKANRFIARAWPSAPLIKPAAEEVEISE